MFFFQYPLDVITMCSVGCIFPVDIRRTILLKLQLQAKAVNLKIIRKKEIKLKINYFVTSQNMTHRIWQCHWAPVFLDKLREEFA